jgi:hypothetical protein
MVKLLSGAFDRRVAAGVAVLAAILGSLLYFGVTKSADENSRRPTLMIMSSIPLIWGEATMAQVAKGEAQPSPLFEALAENNRPVLIDDFQKLGSPGNTPLLLVQPRALAPRELVQLDDWVRKGGTAIIFADPALDWPSDYPLGDQRRPLFTSLLNPLFRHWGVELALPVADDDNADVATNAGEYALATKSRGILVVAKNPKVAARCSIRRDEFIAYCAVGKGRALIVADVDMLHESSWSGGLLTSGTMDWLQSVITAAQKTTPFPDNLWEIEGY